MFSNLIALHFIIYSFRIILRLNPALANRMTLG